MFHMCVSRRRRSGVSTYLIPHFRLIYEWLRRWRCDVAFQAHYLVIVRFTHIAVCVCSICVCHLKSHTHTHVYTFTYGICGKCISVTLRLRLFTPACGCMRTSKYVQIYYHAFTRVYYVILWSIVCFGVAGKCHFYVLPPISASGHIFLL